MNTVRLGVLGAVGVGVALLLAVALVLILPPTAPSVPTQVDVEIRLVAGEVGNALGFAREGQAVTSPGPNLTVTAGDVVRVVLTNAGQMPHNFAVVQELRSDAPVLFGAAIQSGSNPMSPGETRSVTFTVGSAGTFYYICQVAGHVQMGMYGRFIVG